MPHLMFETFMSQWIWLIIFIFGLYYQLVTVLIPKISNAFKARRNLESGDLTQASTAGHTALALDLTSPSIKPLASASHPEVFKKNFTSWSASL